MEHGIEREKAIEVLKQSNMARSEMYITRFGKDPNEYGVPDEIRDKMAVYSVYDHIDYLKLFSQFEQYNKKVGKDVFPVDSDYILSLGAEIVNTLNNSLENEPERVTKVLKDLNRERIVRVGTMTAITERLKGIKEGGLPDKEHTCNGNNCGGCRAHETGCQHKTGCQEHTESRQKRIYRNKVNHGFNVVDLHEEARFILREVIELMQGITHRDKDNIIEELADIVIFSYGLAEIIGRDLDTEIEHKMNINEQRVYKKDEYGDFVKV